MSLTARAESTKYAALRGELIQSAERMVEEEHKERKKERKKKRINKSFISVHQQEMKRKKRTAE
jgi:GMP synthase PP-ATPase subunit